MRDNSSGSWASARVRSSSKGSVRSSWVDIRSAQHRYKVMTSTYSRAMRVFTEDGSEEADAKLASLVIRAPPIHPSRMHDPDIPTEVRIAAYRRAVDHRHVSDLRCVAS